MKKDFRNKRDKFDPIPAEAENRERAKMMKEMAYKKRKSPDVRSMFGIRTYFPLTDWYFQNMSKRNRFLSRIGGKYELIEPRV